MDKVQQRKKKMSITHSFEVAMAAVLALVSAVEHHLLEVMADPIHELLHVERLGLVGCEVGPFLQKSEHIRLRQVWLRDGQVHVQQRQQLSSVVQVVAGQVAEAVDVEVTNGDGRENQTARHHGVQTGQVRVGEEVREPLCALQSEQSQAGQQGCSPEQAANAGMTIWEDEAQAV